MPPALKRLETTSQLFAPAPQLPGGTDPSRLAGAALIRDFGRLENSAPISETVKRSSLRIAYRCCGCSGDLAQSIQQFVQRRELLISLTEQDLIDRMFPGVYRALIKEVRATGILGGAIPLGLRGIPLSVTHLGESRTRIKRSANPFAPPVELPTCFPVIWLRLPNMSWALRSSKGPFRIRPPTTRK